MTALKSVFVAQLLWSVMWNQ